MSDSGSRPHQGGSVPSWARFMESGQFQALVDLVSAELERREIPFDFDVEGGLVRLPKPENDGAALGLVNLAQICHQSPFHTWPATVAQHVGRSIDLASESDGTIEELVNDFEQARKRLKFRLYPSDVGSDIFMTLVEPMSGVKAVLVFDMPETIHSVRQDHIEAWGRSLEELFAIALANVKAEDPVEQKSYSIDETASVSLLGGGSFFTASHALCLDDYLSPVPDAGALVAVPHRHAVIYHPIVDQGVVVAINTMIPMALGMFREGPGSISPNLYWWHDGHYTLLPAEIGTSTIEFKPPEEFIEMLSQFMS